MKKYPALYLNEYGPVCFQWIIADNSKQSVYMYLKEKAKAKVKSSSVYLI